MVTVYINDKKLKKKKENGGVKITNQNFTSQNIVIIFGKYKGSDG